MSALFREQAVKAQGERLLGDVVISQPLALRILVFLLLAIVVAIGVIGANATYARKETVTGYVFAGTGNRTCKREPVRRY